MATILDLFRGRGLTKPAVVSPSGTEFYDNPQEQAQGIVATQQAPETTMDSAPIPYQDASGQANNDNSDVPVQSGEVDAKAVTPTFNQVAKDRYGNVRQGNNQGLSKLGLLAKVLVGGLQGGVDAIEGGALDAPRNGESNFGKGLGAARTMPLIRASRVQQQQRGQLENDILQGQSQPIDTPLGPMPMWKARQLAEFQKTQAEITNKNADTEYKKKHGDYFEKDKLPTLQQLHAQATQKAIAEGRDPNQDPQVQQYADQITALQRQPQPKEPTNSFQAYLSAFKAKNGRDMTPEEISAYDKQHAQNIHINTGQSDVAPDDFETLVQGLVKGSIDPKSAFGRGGTQLRARAIAEATRRDPKFSMADYPLRQQAYQYFFGNGKGADQIQSANTLIQHSKDLSDVVNDYRAAKSPLLNKPLNWIRKNFGDATYSRYVAALQPVRDEFMTYLQNNHALTNEDRKAGDLILSDDATPAQQQEAIKQLTHTAAIRLGENNNRFRRVFGEDYPEILPPDSEKFLRDVGAYDSVFKNKVKGRSSSAPSGNPKTPAPSKDGITFIPLG